MAFVFQKLKREKDGQVEKYVTGKAYALARLGSSLEWTETDFCQDLLNDSAFHSRAQNFFRYNLGRGYRQVHAYHIPELLKAKAGGPRCWVLLTSKGVRLSGLYKR